MKTCTKFLLFFFFISALTSCSSDDDVAESAVDRRSDVEVTILNNNSVDECIINGISIYKYDYALENTSELIYAIHKKDGSFVKMNILTKDELVFNEQKNLVLTDKLDEGQYFISVFRWIKDYKIDSSSLELLKKSYDEAIFVSDPKQQTFFETIELNVKSGKKLKETIQLKEMSMTFDLVFMDTKDIPNSAKVKIDVSVKDLPVAFYLKNKETLSNEQIGRFSESIEITNKPKSCLLAQYFVINNNNITDSRGTLSVDYNIENDSEPKKVAKVINLNVPKSEIITDTQFQKYTYVFGFYDSEAKLSDEIIRKSVQIKD